jgi:bile acid-coenzyme A ligase
LFDYIGLDRPKVIDGGFVSVGDLAYCDADGYIYSADRRRDLIITGGANVVPAEVEAALGEHPEVADVSVIGLPDEEWGKRVHAIVEPVDSDRPPSTEELRTFAKSRLSSYKVPKSFELVAALPRSEMFKVRRTALVDERADPEAGT